MLQTGRFVLPSLLVSDISSSLLSSWGEQLCSAMSVKMTHAQHLSGPTHVKYFISSVAMSELDTGSKLKETQSAAKKKERGGAATLSWGVIKISANNCLRQDATLAGCWVPGPICGEVHGCGWPGYQPADFAV